MGCWGARARAHAVAVPIMVASAMPTTMRNIGSTLARMEPIPSFFGAATA